MSDICISYSSKDRAIASNLREKLESEWEVWWDQQITGYFDKEIEEAFSNTKLIIAILTSNSKENQNVNDELRIGLENKVPICFFVIEEKTSLPYMFKALPKFELNGWDGQEHHIEFSRFLTWIKLLKLQGRRTAKVRPDNRLDDRKKFPYLFHSTSSFNTKLNPENAFKILNLFGQGSFLDQNTHSQPMALVSAYDLSNCTGKSCENNAGLISQMMEFHDNDGFIMIDSGNYESSRMDDKGWSHEKFGEALQNVPHDWVLSFDYKMGTDKQTHAITDFESIAEGIERDRGYTDKPIIPIIHATENELVGYDATTLPLLVLKLVKEIDPPMVAIPERELGAGLCEAVLSVQAIRQALGEHTHYIPIHILGTGNPLSIALYVSAGADSFDGLEWCRYCLDDRALLLHHYQHFEFFQQQAENSENAVVKEALKDKKVGLPVKIGLHNLDVYNGYCHKLRTAVNKDKLELFCSEVFAKDQFSYLRGKIGSIF